MRLLALCIMCAIPGVLAAQGAAVVKTDGTNVRTMPSVEAPVIAVLRRGVPVTILERRDAWTRISAGTTTGWLRESSLDRPSASPTGSPPTPQPVAGPAPMPVPSQPVPTLVTDQGRRGGFTVGVLASMTPADASTWRTSAKHVAGLPFVEFDVGPIGIYAAPEVGSGAGYRSTMLGGGVLVGLVRQGRLQVRALGGYTTYSETPTAAGAPAAEGWSSQGASFGGLASFRLFGTVRLAYRGQYVVGFGDNAELRFARHSAGLLF
jgi:hypothetical protein